jgi:hypothetical protein
MSLRLLTDSPLGEGQCSRTDALGFDGFASLLANAIASTQGPFTVGIYGEWGSGKTSLMRLIEQRLHISSQPRHEENTITTAWFPAWRYAREEQPIVPLVATITSAIGPARNSKAAALVAALKSVAYSFTGSAELGLGPLGKVQMQFDAAKAVSGFQKLRRKTFEMYGLYEDAYRELAKAASSAYRVVVMIDDLDRCMPDTVVSLLESIRLVLSQPGFTFVLGIDRRTVESYVRHVYRDRFGLTGETGASYLDKIVQLPFAIPPHHDRAGKLVECLLTELESGSEPRFRNELKSLAPLLALTVGANPRTVVRFINSIMLDKALCASAGREKGLGIIPMCYFAVSRLIQSQWPDQYTKLTSNPALCTLLADAIETQNASLSADGKNVDELAPWRQNTPLWSLLRTKFGFWWLRNGMLRQAAVDFLYLDRAAEQLASYPEAPDYDIYLCYDGVDHGDVSRLSDLLVKEQLKVADRYRTAVGREVGFLLRRFMRARWMGVVVGSLKAPSPIQMHQVKMARAFAETYGYPHIVAIVLGKRTTEAAVAALNLGVDDRYLLLDLEQREVLDLVQRIQTSKTLGLRSPHSAEQPRYVPKDQPLDDRAVHLGSHPAQQSESYHGQDVLFILPTDVSSQTDRVLHLMQNAVARAGLSSANLRVRDFVSDSAHPGTLTIDGRLVPLAHAYAVLVGDDVNMDWLDSVVNALTHAKCMAIVVACEPSIARTLSDSELVKKIVVFHGSTEGEPSLAVQYISDALRDQTKCQAQKAID